MFNYVKKKIYSFLTNVKLQRGKMFVGRIVVRTLGMAVFDIEGVTLELSSISHIDRLLISKSGHDPIVKEMIHSQLQQGGVFIDVGANIGYFSIMAARIPNVHVFAFEPSPRELSRLYRNISLNELAGTLTVFPYGLSEQESVLPLHLSEAWNPGMNSVLDLPDEIKCIKTVNRDFVPLSMLLSDCICSRVRLCKIDVEGYELFVLRGMEARIDTMTNAVFIVEITPAFLSTLKVEASDIYQFFERHGFKPRFGIQSLEQYDEVFSRQ